MKRILLLPFTGLLLGVLALALLLASNLYTYHRLTAEAPIAELSFRQIGPQQFEASIAWGDFCDAQQFLLYGDQWRLDAQFLKWRPWANLLGFDAMYRIERLGGRYAAVDAENTGQHQAYALHAAERVDLPAVLARYSGAFSPVDTLYGSSVYAAMSEGRRYRVYRGQSGLLVRDVPDAAADRKVNGITIDITTGCQARRGLLDGVTRVAGRLNRAPATP
ncbi:MAG: hypothetical protein R3F42_09140 [Pseudomonadota bacterium]